MKTRLSPVLAAVATLAFGLAGQGALAQAVPLVQKTSSVCSVDGTGGGNVVAQLSQDGWLPVAGMAITVVNRGSSVRNAYITFSADAGVVPDAELRLGFSLDGGTSNYMGPQNLANASQYWATRTALAVVAVPPGTHVITPIWHVNGAEGTSGVMDDRCMFVTL